MDTDQLHQIACDAGVSFKDEDAYHDLIYPWTEALLADPEWLADFFLDFLAEFHSEDKWDEWKALVSDLSFAAVNEEHATKAPTPGLTLACATAAAQYYSIGGRRIAKVLREQAEEYVAKNAQEWWEDVYRYECDMREGQLEDWKYEQWKEKQHDS